MKVTVNSKFADIPAPEWNALAGREYPFLRHEFLLAAEESGSVSPDTGWTPRHLTLSGRGNELRAALILYEKSHSWGEFVFDWAWARAYEQAGLRYYPKLVSAVPFTPAPSRRLLLADPADPDAARILIRAALQLAEETECSSFHVLFPRPDELACLESGGMHVRKDCQFHWHNHNYRTFDDFLATFSSAKRKKAKRDRRKVADAGIDFRRLRGTELTPELWETIYRLISITFMRRGSLPYFTPAFFVEISQRLPDELLVILAEKDSRAVAAAVYFVGENTLYGRYWGSDSYYDALHFETCYHQGIEYCIDNEKQFFEPGTQGEHKISRGFVPVETWSAHWLGQPGFFDAIGDYLDQERRHVERYMAAIDSHSPYKSTDES